MSKKPEEEKAKPVFDKEIQKAARLPLAGGKKSLGSMRMGSFSGKDIKISKEKVDKDVFDKKIEAKGE